jgi:hypothetical protein
VLTANTANLVFARTATCLMSRFCGSGSSQWMVPDLSQSGNVKCFYVAYTVPVAETFSRVIAKSSGSEESVFTLMDAVLYGP